MLKLRIQKAQVDKIQLVQHVEINMYKKTTQRSNNSKQMNPTN